MTLEKVTEKSANVIELEITVPADEFETAVQHSYKKNIGKMTIPGFRRGKAPRKMVEKMYGASIFYDDAMEEVYPEAYKAAVKEAGIEPVDRADVEIIGIDESGFKFKATVTVKPKIEIKNYKGIKLEKPSVEVTEADVAAELARVQKQQSRLVDITDRAAENGDTVVIDFEGFVDGKAFEGGKSEGYNLKLGSGSFIPGFEDQIVGKNIGDEFDVNVTFPEEYTEELKGKPATFKVKVNAVKFEELPVLDDEFVKDISDFETLDEYTADVKAKLTKNKEDAAEAEIDSRISAKLAELVEGEIPQCMFDSEVDYQMSSFANRLKAQGMSIELYAQYTGTTVEGMKEMFKPNAEQDVKVRLALEKIAEIEKVIVEESDIDAEYEKFAETYKTEVDNIKSDYVTENITKDLVVRKAFELVKNNAEISDAKSEKTTAKKTAAKKTTTSKKPAAKKAEDTENKKKPAAKKTATAKKTTSTTAKKTTTKKTTAKKTEEAE